jgi:two-component system sensor histidine kinase UhpB
LLSNAAVVGGAVFLLGVTPSTVSWPLAGREAVVLVIGFIAVLAANYVLLRPMFSSLNALSAQLTEARLLRPGQTLVVTGGGDVTLAESVNRLLQRLEYERRENARAVLAALETERKRIARELHDEVGQTMLAVLMVLESLRDDVPPHRRELLGRAVAAVRDGAEEFRRISEDLRPVLLDRFGLAGALTGLTEAFSVQTGIEVACRITPDRPALDAGMERAVFRVAQESLTNAGRHSGASRVELELTGEPHQVVLQVTDNGRGISEATLRGRGLTAMQERARVLGGEATVERLVTGGTRIRLVLPV